MEDLKVQEKTVNGVNIAVVQDTINLASGQPEMAHSTFKITNQWNGGIRSTTTMGDMFAAEQIIPHKTELAIQSDEPEMLSGTDLAPNPVEQLLSALASCVTTSIIAHSAVRGITINALSSEIEGDIDLNGFLDLDSSVPIGYSEIRVKLLIDTDYEDIGEVASLHRFSPVYNTIINATPVRVEASQGA